MVKRCVKPCDCSRGTDQIYMHMIKTFAGDEELLKGCLSVFMDLRMLAWSTRCCQFLHRFMMAWLNKVRPDQFNRGPDPWMR